METHVLQSDLDTRDNKAIKFVQTSCLVMWSSKRFYFCTNHNRHGNVLKFASLSDFFLFFTLYKESSYFLSSLMYLNTNNLKCIYTKIIGETWMW